MNSKKYFKTKVSYMKCMWKNLFDECLVNLVKKT